MNKNFRKNEAAELVTAIKTLSSILMFLFICIRIYRWWRQLRGEEMDIPVFKPIEPAHTKVEEPVVQIPKAAAKRVKAAKSPTLKISSLNARQQKILKIVKSRKRISMADLLPQVEGVTERTLRRDMTKLEKEGAVFRIGKTKNTVYSYAQ